jgi:hypothetical protein
VNEWLSITVFSVSFASYARCVYPSEMFITKLTNYVQNHFAEKAGRDLAIMQLREKREKFLMVT